MVILHIKRGSESQFLFETLVTSSVSSISKEIFSIYNGRLKILRICAEMGELIKHGPMFQPELIGLTDDQRDELKSIDLWIDEVVPMDGWVYNPDPKGRRNGRQPNDQMQNILKQAINESKELISKKLIDKKIHLTLKVIQEALKILQGAVTIVYPMQLPPHDVIQMELSNTEQLTGTVTSLDIIDPLKGQLWFAGRQMICEDHLCNYVGQNEKCTAIVKLTKFGEGPPGREPIISAEVRKQLMLSQYRRKEELKHLEEDEDDHYLDSEWVDNKKLQKDLNGLQNVSYRCGM